MSAFSAHSGHHMRLVPIPLYRVLAFIIPFPAVLGELGRGKRQVVWRHILISDRGVREGERKQFAGGKKSRPRGASYVSGKLSYREINGRGRDSNGGSDGTSWPRYRRQISVSHRSGSPILRQSLCTLCKGVWNTRMWS